MRRLAHAAAAGLAVLALAACAGTSPDADDLPSAPEMTIPFTMQPPITAMASQSGGITGVGSVVLDDDGVYLCVLRRAGDLASLRASFSAKAQSPISDSTG